MGKKQNDFLRRTCFIGVTCLFILLGQIYPAEIEVLDSRYRLISLTEDTPLSGCNGAVIGADGALYVVHTGNGVITRIDLETRKAETFIPAYEGVTIPDDITADGAGNLYVTGTTSFVGRIYRIDKNRKKTTIAGGFISPNGIQYNLRTERLFMSECFEGNRVFELDPHEKKEPRLLVAKDIIAIPEGFGFDRETHDLIIPDMGTGKILRVHPDTGRITTIAENFEDPVALKIGPDNKAYIAELLSGAVFRLSLDGKEREKLAQLYPGIDNLAISEDGRLFVTSYWDATVFEVATDGSGKFAPLFPKGPDQITGIALKDRTVYISDNIMIRRLDKGEYIKTKLNSYTAKGMPMPFGVIDGVGEELIWTDWFSGSVVAGNPSTGKFRVIADKLDRPVDCLLSEDRQKVYVAEYGSDQVSEINLASGKRRVIATDLDGPVDMAVAGNELYVAEAKAGRISLLILDSGRKEIVISGVIGRPGDLAMDGKSHLLVIDSSGKRLLRLGLDDLSISLVAKALPIASVVMVDYPFLKLPIPMRVSEDGDIYLATENRGLIMFQKTK